MIVAVAVHWVWYQIAVYRAGKASILPDKSGFPVYSLVHTCGETRNNWGVVRFFSRILAGNMVESSP